MTHKTEETDYYFHLVKTLQKTNDLIGGLHESIIKPKTAQRVNDTEAVVYPGIIQHDPADLDSYGSFKFYKINSGFILRPLVPPEKPGPASLALADFIGIDGIIMSVFKNTIKFASGKPANNVLLWGDRGTGKSSLIRSISSSFNEEPYIGRIKFIEVVEDTAEVIYELISVVKSMPYRFILIFDDIAFDAGSIIYKKLKSILDGGLDELPDNVIIYATSNKRHLVTERFSDGADFAAASAGSDFIHPEEEVEEGLSLSDRFGLSFGFYAFDADTYLRIVDLYIKKYGIKISSMDIDEVKKDALNFATSKGSRSGRTARQFAVSLIKD